MGEREREGVRWGEEGGDRREKSGKACEGERSRKRGRGKGRRFIARERLYDA